jgi:hypothetical protein
LNDLSKLMAQIEQLSLESRAKLTDYIAFLQWQEEQEQTQEIKNWSYSFIEAFKTASVYATEKPAGMDVKMAPAVVGGEKRPALWAHPPLVGQAVIEYYVPIPHQLKNIQLRLAFGIRDGAQIFDSNLVAYGVKVNGIRVWGQQSNTLAWQEANIALAVTAGDMVRFEFTTEALNSHEWTWAVWGNPELIGTINN